MILIDDAASQDREQVAAIRVATGTLGAGLALAFTCPAVAAAGIGALAGSTSGASRGWSIAKAIVAAACVAALVLAFVVPHEPPRWVMLAFGGIGLVATLALTLAGLRFGPTLGRTCGAGFAALAAWGVLMAMRPAGWICVASTIVILAMLAIGHLRTLRAGG